MSTISPDNNRPSSSTSPSQEWHLGSLPPSISLFVLAALVGLLAGLGAFVLKETIKWLSLLLVSHFHKHGVNWALLSIPIAGILLTVALQRYGLKRNIEHGLDKIGDMVRRGQYNIPATYTYGPVLASTLTLGFGGSAGAEGPIASTGAALASQLGRWVGLPPRLMMIIIGCGAGAGIAGIFKAPVGGMMFTLEVMGMEMTTVAVIALTIACVIGGMTSYGMTGFSLDPSPIFRPSHERLGHSARSTVWIIFDLLFTRRRADATFARIVPFTMAKGFALRRDTCGACICIPIALRRGLRDNGPTH